MNKSDFIVMLHEVLNDFREFNLEETPYSYDILGLDEYLEFEVLPKLEKESNNE